MQNRKTFLTPAELAERWNCTIGHLANLRARHEGVRWYKPAGRVVYRLDDVEAFEASTVTEVVA